MERLGCLNLGAPNDSCWRCFGLWLTQTFCRVHSPEPARSCCRCRQTWGYRKRQGNPSELLQKAIGLLLRTKGCDEPACGGPHTKPRAFNNNLTRLPDCGSLRGSCNCFRRVLVCKLLTEKPKESRNRPLAHNLSQPSNPRPTRLLGSYSSPTATGLSLYEIQSLQLLIPLRIPMLE